MQPPFQIMDQLLAKNSDILKIYTSLDSDCQMDKKYLTAVQIVQICSFTETGPTEFNSKNEAILKTFDFLHRIAIWVK